jgi:TolA-binding protein
MQREQIMKWTVWILVVIVLIVSSAPAATMDFPRGPMKLRPNYVQIAFIHNGISFDLPISAEGKAKVKQREFMNRLSELKGKYSDLEMQTFELNQENLDMQSQLEQNTLELKQVEIDRKGVRRTIKELEREKNIFDKKDRLRKKTDQSQFGN